MSENGRHVWDNAVRLILDALVECGEGGEEGPERVGKRAREIAGMAKNSDKRGDTFASNDPMHGG